MGAGGSRQLFLHIGTRKSGTSYLQATVFASVPELARQGLGVPFTSWEKHSRFLDRPLRRIQPGGDLPAAAGTGLDNARRICDATPGDRLLVTFEDLAALSAEQAQAVKSAFAGYDIHVVLTARDLARQIPSEWQQLVKERLLVAFPDYVGLIQERSGADADLFWRRQDAAEILARWGADLPPENVHVITVPQSSADRGLLPARFFGLLGVDPDRLSAPSRSVNPSLGYVEAELLRRVNVEFGDRLPRQRGDYRVAVRKVLRGPLLHRKGVTPVLPEEYWGWVVEASSEMAGRIGEQGFSIIGDLDELVSAVPEAALEPPTDSELLEVAVGVLAEIAVKRVGEINEANRVGARVQSVPRRTGRLRRVLTRVRRGR